jgi:hypothetical protein
VATDTGKTGWIPVGDVKPIVATNVTDLESWLSAVKFGQASNTLTGRIITATQGNTSSNGDNPSSGIFRVLTDSAVAFHDSYKNNPYIQVSGFTVHVGVPPSVDLSFSFK